MLQSKIAEMRKELNARLIERSPHIDIILACLVSGQHAFLFGPPGCGKSLMLRILRDMISDIRYFEILMAASTRPIELCGPPSLAKLSAGEYHVETDGYLPWAHLAFLDEIWKANSAILNTLLTLINERTYKNGKNIDKASLLSLFGASNELPDDDSLGALDDRFVARLVVNPVDGRESFRAIMRMNREKPPKAPVIISLEEIVQIHNIVSQIPVSDAFDDALYDIRTALFKEFGPSFILSERRLAMVVKLAQGLAFILGKSSVEPSLLPMLTCCFWKELSQIPVIQNVLDGFAAKVVKDYKQEVMTNVLPKLLDVEQNVSSIEKSCKVTGKSEKQFKGLGESIVEAKDKITDYALLLKGFDANFTKDLDNDTCLDLVESKDYISISDLLSKHIVWARKMYVYYESGAYATQPPLPSPGTSADLKNLLK